METTSLDFEPYTKPFEHQARTWADTRDLRDFAVFWEQGTGKTKLTIDTMAHLYCREQIGSAIIVAPNGVHLNWVTDELPRHLPPGFPINTHVYATSKARNVGETKTRESFLASSSGLSFLAISYDGWMTEIGKKLVWKMMKKRPTLLVLDESHRVKTPDANRTRSILAGGRHAAFRRILSGTPVTNGPFDVYSQIRFLDPEFWARELDIDSFTAFKAFFGVWEKKWNQATDKEFDLLVDYQNLDELAKAIKLISSRVTKEDVLDLPPKLYSKRYYQITPAQRKVYEPIEKDYMAWLESGELITTPLAIVRMLRLQQVLCGYVPVDGEDEPRELISKDENPRLKLLRELMEDVSGKTIIWATWTLDINMIMETLQAMGRNPVRYDGRVSDKDRAAAKDAFKHGDATDFVANTAMSEGLTLTESRTTIYYNNNYKLLDRQQSEDRNHRIGQLGTVNVYDLVCPGTRDEHAIAALVKKSEVAATILGDKRKDWL